MTPIPTLDLSSATFLDSLRPLARTRSRGVTFYDGRGRPRRVPYADLWQRALAFGGGLRRRGLGPGDAVVLVLPEPEEALIAILGALAAGCPPAPIYPPVSTQSVVAFVRYLEHVAQRAQARHVVVGAPIYPFIGAIPRDVPCVRGVDRFASVAAGAPITVAPMGPEDTAFLQFTSGSTAAPKGVQVTHRCLAANLWMIRAAAGIDESSAAVTWLPIYHDMGLIGTVFGALALQIDLAVMSPRTFLRDPALWLRAIADHRGTHTAAPNFAFGLCVKRIPDPRGFDLSSMRSMICGAEPIVPETLERFAEVFAAAGLDPGALAPAYGLAEATLAVTFMPRGAGLRCDEVDAGALAEMRVAQAPLVGASRLRVASCGVPMPGLDLRIASESEAPLAERLVGEVQVRGPSVTPGYIFDPAATRAARTDDGWLRTGDLGYLANGHLYVCGRSKDVIIVRGRNLHAHDVEALAGASTGVRTGNVCAFGSLRAADAEVEPGTGEHLVVIAESREPEQAGMIAREIRGRIWEALSVVPDQVMIVPPGTLPKTSSGKLRRAETKRRYETGSLALQEQSSLEALSTVLRSGVSHVLSRMRAP